MMLQTAAADLLTELRVLASPASIHSVPTGAGREDHVSMGPAAARKAIKLARALAWSAAVELISAAEAVEHHRPLTSSKPIEKAIAAIRKHVARMTRDRPLSADVTAVAEMVRSGAFGT